VLLLWPTNLLEPGIPGELRAGPLGLLGPGYHGSRRQVPDCAQITAFEGDCLRLGDKPLGTQRIPRARCGACPSGWGAPQPASDQRLGLNDLPRRSSGLPFGGSETPSSYFGRTPTGPAIAAGQGARGRSTHGVAHATTRGSRSASPAGGPPTWLQPAPGLADRSVSHLARDTAGRAGASQGHQISATMAPSDHGPGQGQSKRTATGFLARGLRPARASDHDPLSQTHAMAMARTAPFAAHLISTRVTWAWGRATPRAIPGKPPPCRHRSARVRCGCRTAVA